MSFYRNILSHAGATAIGSGVQLVLILALSRWLSIENFAGFIAATAVVGLGEMISDFGVRIWSTRQFAIRDNSEDVLGSALLAKAGFSILLLATILLFPVPILSPEQALLAVLIACIQPSTDPLLWYMRGKGRLDVEAAVTLSWRLANAALLGATAFFVGGLTWLLLGWLVSNAIRTWGEWNMPLLGIIRQGHVFGMEGLRTRALSVARLSFPVGLAFVIMALYQRLGVFVLGKISTPEMVAHFGAAFTLVASAGFVATSITVSSFPTLAKAADAGEWGQVSNIVNQKLWLVMMVFLPACFVGMVVAPWVIAWLYPLAYAPAAVAMVSLLPGLYISSINFALKYVMNILHCNWLDVMSVIVGILIFIAFLLFYKEGKQLLAVAGLGWGIGEASIFLIKWAVLHRDERVNQIKLGRHLAIFMALLCFLFIIR